MPKLFRDIPDFDTISDLREIQSKFFPEGSLETDHEDQLIIYTGLKLVQGTERLESLEQYEEDSTKILSERLDSLSETCTELRGFISANVRVMADQADKIRDLYRMIKSDDNS